MPLPKNATGAAMKKALDYYVSVFQDKKASAERRDRAAKMVLLSDDRGAAMLDIAHKRSLKNIEASARSKLRAKQRRVEPGKKAKTARAVETAGHGSKWEDEL